MITINDNVISPLAKRVLIPLGLTAAASGADAGIQKKKKISEDQLIILRSQFRIIIQY